MTNVSTLADDVSSAVIEHFISLPRAQPVARSNGLKEWTVLAGIVSIHDGVVNRLPICVTTGVKAMPDHLISKFDGRVLHDCHAEMLALRAFNLFVIKEVKKLRGGEGSVCLETSEDERYGFKLRDDIQFAMYVSELPCGDASLELLIDEGEPHWDRITELGNGVLRGRESYTLKGKVRTKPGRRDSPLTLSKSCSDKLCLKQFTGILNSITGQFVDPEGFFLNWLVFPQDRSIDDALQRCFKTRLKLGHGEDLISFRQFQFLKTKEHHGWERSDETPVPSNLSILSIPSHDIFERIINGVKDGFYTKKTMVRPKGQSSVSRLGLVEECKELVNLDSIASYTELKSMNEWYQKSKKEAQGALGGWCHTHIDDFDIVI